MILKGLEMQGFKSFPDKTYLKFGRGMTAVVGPNGSGKSNISDAVRWVLGEQSTKNLRGAKMEDVIFGGTDARKALGFAEVTLQLDNTDRSLNKDTDSVSITRRYYRSGESEYKINGEECRLRDIHEMFMDTGLGRDGYSMVSQGRIADLVSAKSSQRRDMLEEASGISHFRYRRTDANRRLDQAEENLVRLRDILAELEGRIGPLKTQSEKAQKFIVLAGEKKTLEIGVWLHTIEKSKNGLRDIEHKLTLATSQYEDTEAKLEEINEKIEQALEHARQLTSEVENMRQNISDAEKQASVIEGEVNVRKNTIQHNILMIERIRYNIDNGEKDVADIDKQISDAEKANEEKEAEIEGKRSELQKEIDKLNTLLTANGENSDKVASLNEQLTDATMRSADLRVEKTTCESSANELEERIRNIDALVSSRSGVIDELEEEKAAAENVIRKLRDQYSENENALEGYKLIIDSRTGKADKLHKEIDDINLDIYQKNARIKMLDDLEKNLDGYAGSVQKVIKESKRGALRGIHGTVSQLINVQGEYAVAIETALGSSVQDVVTDDENSAKRAITFLKENRAGRATFLPLTSVKERPFNEKGLDKCEGFIDMADRLLDYDKKYDGIISNLLSRVAVVDNIDNGIAMAKKYSYHFKIVTLDGQVLNAGGSITGGSRGAGSGLLSRMNEIEELKEAVAQLEKDLKEKDKSFTSISSEISTAQAELDASESEMIKIQEDIIRAESDLKLATDRYNSAKGHIDELLAEKDRASEKIKNGSKVVKEADEKLAVIAKEIDEINAKLDQLNQQRESLEENKEKSAEIQNNLNIEIVALKKEIEANNSVIEECTLRKKNYSQQADELLNEITGFENTNKEIEENIKVLEQQCADLRKGSVDTKELIEKLVEERTGSEADTTKLRAQEKVESETKEKLSGELVRLGERKENLQRDLDTTLNKLYDEHGLSLSEAQEIGEIPEDIPLAQRTLAEIRSKIKALGNVNVGAIEEYKEVSERYEYMSTQLNDIEKSKTELIKLINELTDKMAERFREQFRRINIAFGESFRELFDGGKAELVLDDPHDVLECNINIKVQPPGKNVQNIDLLSGGEKGLAAIALLIAILKVNPAPFCIFDEVEAALDDINVSKYAQYLRGMCENIQFILITHRRGTMEEADILYGVTMQEEGVSKLLELKSAEMARKLGLE